MENGKSEVWLGESDGGFIYIIGGSDTFNLTLMVLSRVQITLQVTLSVGVSLLFTVLVAYK